jgi:hypothetical protein
MYDNSIAKDLHLQAMDASPSALHDLAFDRMRQVRDHALLRLLERHNARPISASVARAPMLFVHFDEEFSPVPSQFGQT